MKNVEPRWYLACNPVAGDGKGNRMLPALLDTLKRAGINPEVELSKYKGHVQEMITTAIQRGFDHIIAAGGDGTNHEAVQAIMDLQNPVSITYGLFPSGTGNDWARTHAISTRPEKWISMLVGRNTALHDIGVVKMNKEATYFINMCGTGFDGFLVHFMEERPKKGGNGLYYLKGLIKGIQKFVPSIITISIDNGAGITDTFYNITIGVGRYAGGGMHVCPHANPFDGNLGITLAGDLSKKKIFMNIPKLYNGRIGRLSKVQLITANHIAFKSEKTLHIEVDGEYLGRGAATVSVIPKAMKVLIP